MNKQPIIGVNDSNAGERRIGTRFNAIGREWVVSHKAFAGKWTCVSTDHRIADFAPSEIRAGLIEQVAA